MRMVCGAYLGCLLVMLLSFDSTLSLDCPSWWPWCSSIDPVSTGTKTTVRPMTTLPGSFCNCLLFPWARNWREKLVTKLMEDAFVHVTYAITIKTKAYSQIMGPSFDLVKYILSKTKVSTLQDSFGFVRNGSLFNDNFFTDTSGYLKFTHPLSMAIHDLYVYPLSYTLQSIAVKHGISIGVYRAGETLTYSGICSTSQDQENSTDNWNVYLFEQQCQINLSYWIQFSLNGSCLTSKTASMRTARAVESTFDGYFSGKDLRYVRSAITNLSLVNGRTEICVRLFFNSDGIIEDIVHHLKSMDPIYLNCSDSRTDSVSSTFRLVNCTWYEKVNGSGNCMPSNRSTTLVTTSVLQESTLATQMTDYLTLTGSTDSQGRYPILLDDSSTENSSAQLNASTPDSMPEYYTPLDVATGAPQTSTVVVKVLNSTFGTAEIPPSTLLTTASYLFSNSTEKALNSTISTAPVSSPSSITTGATVSPVNSDATDLLTTLSPTSHLEMTDTSSSYSSLLTQQLLLNTNYASNTTATKLLLSTRMTFGTTLPMSVSAVTTGHSVNNTTPFDSDPFFKAVVPVVTKKYNDVLLLRVVGTMSPLTSQENFYWITIPVFISAIILAMLCLICLQIDWLAFCSEAGKSRKITEH